MGLFKRVVSAGAVAGLLFVSAAAMADDENGAPAPEVVTSESPSETADVVDDNNTLVDVTDDGDANSDNGGDGTVPDVDPTMCTPRPLESIYVSGKLVDYVTAGTPEFIFETGFVDANEIDEDIALELFEASSEPISSEDFIKFLEPFDDPEVDLTKIQGIQKVTVSHMMGVACAESDGISPAITYGKSFEFEVIFPLPSINPPFQMGVLFDERPIGVVLMQAGDFDAIENLQALNGKELSIDDFMVAMSYFGGDADAAFPQNSEACGKHTVQFVDDEGVWSIVTVVYPGTAAECNPVAPPANNTPANPPSNGGGYGSYSQFLGSNASRYTPVAPRSVVVGTTDGTTGEETGEVAEPEEAPANDPGLPVTGQEEFVKGDMGAPVAEDSSSSHGVLAWLAVALAVIAVASVFGVHQVKKS